MARIRNNHNLRYWALCNAASSFGNALKSSIPTYFGIALHNSTLMSILQDIVPYDVVMVKTVSTLKEYWFCVSIFDNAQDFVSLKFQRQGKSSWSIVVTSRCFVKPHIPEFFPQLLQPNMEVDINYISQAIPSAYGMPALETSCDLLDPQSYILSSNPDRNDLDLTGARVDMYYKLAINASTVQKLGRLLPRNDSHSFSFMDADGDRALKQMKIASKLKSNRSDDFGHDDEGFYSYMGLFQTKATAIWRGDVPQCSMIIPPISPEDETTNKGAGKVILSLLALYGILEKTTQTSEEGNPKGLQLAEGYDKRYLVIVGDGLSQVRARTFSNLMQECSNSFGDKHEKSIMIQKALNQIIHVPGDLHGGCFHFLSAVYTLFYGSLIQPIQIMLGWKRIRGSDVTKCYQQAAGLALMISNELERHLLLAYLKEIHSDLVKRRHLESLTDPKRLALEIANGYNKWIDFKRSQTNDECFQMALNFVTMMEMYRLFRISLRAGDAVMIEALYCKFLPYYQATGKRNYVQIVLSNIDAFYSEIPANLLHLVRINRTSPLYKGNDKYGRPMANWALDAIIELQQKFYHRMKQGSVEGWLKNSPHMMLMNKCQRFSNFEYSKVKTPERRDAKMSGDHTDASGSPIDPNNNRKRTWIPKRESEYKCISEFIALSKITEENNGRKYDNKAMWDIIVQGMITTKLEDKNEKDQAQMMLVEALTEEERLCSSVTDELLGDVTQVNDSEEGNDNIMTFNPEEMERNGIESEVESGEEEGATVLNNNNESREGAEDEIILVDRKIKVRKAKPNEIGFKNVYQMGMDQLEKKDLKTTRLRRSKRSKRSDKRKKTMYDRVTGNRNENRNMNPVVFEGFRRLKL